MTHTSDGTPHPLTLKKNQALRKDPEVGRVLDLGTVVSPDVDSRDSFEKVFQKLDTDASLIVTRQEFKNYFCPGLERVQSFPGQSERSDVPTTTGAVSSFSSPVASRAPSRTTSVQPISRSVSVFSQSSSHSAHNVTHVTDDWAPSPGSPSPQGGCCGIGARRKPVMPRVNPRAAPYAAPGVNLNRQTPAAPAVTRSPPSPFRATGNAIRATSGLQNAQASPLKAPASPLAAPASPLAQPTVNLQQPVPTPVAPTIVGKLVEKKVYNISDDELTSLKEELALLRKQVDAKAENLTRSDKRLGEMEKENRNLRAEYNLQSLKQEILVHMWSMHMLDADVEDDAST